MNDRLAALSADEDALQRGGFLVSRTPFSAETAAPGGKDAYDTVRQWSPPAHLLDQPDETERFGTLRDRHAGFEVTSYSRMKKMRGGYAAPAGDEESIYDDRVAEGGKSGLQDDLPGGPRFGRALHAVMETIRFDSLPEKRDDLGQWAAAESVRAFANQALSREGVEQAHAGYLLSLIGNALMSSIPLADGVELPRLAAVQRTARELEFLYPCPDENSPRLVSAQWEDIRIERGFVKGYIDMVFEWEGKLHLLDWKTDILPDYDRTALKEHYEVNYALQAKLYLIALCKLLRVHSGAAYDERVGSVVYCFVRGMSPDDRSGGGLAVTRPSWDELLSFEADLVAGRVFTEEES
jgi:exodeoxyribonuclease V beta subunit